MSALPALVAAHDAVSIDAGLLAAVKWCRLGSRRGERRPTDADFARALRLGLLAHDPQWRSTEQGDGLLIAAGLLVGKPAPRLQTVFVRWLANEHGGHPTPVAVTSDGWRDMDPDGAREFERMCEHEITTHLDTIHDPVFFTTIEEIADPAARSEDV